jgi:MarR family transcriptional regulator, organic hydroperoxide resistance regulator
VNDDPAGVEHRRERIIEGFRAYGRAYGELGQLFATSLGLHSTDALALIEIIAGEERGEPLSQSRLSQRIGLTTGATSSLLNRLEKRGHVTRSRVHDDRRIVTLHSTAGVHQTADDFFDPLGIQLDELTARYPRDVLDQIESFVADLNAMMDGYIVQRSTQGNGN